MRSLLKVKGKPYATDYAPPKLDQYGAWLEWVTDTELQDTMIAANINILRREAPYAFVFVSSTIVKDWLSSQLVQKQPYLQSLAWKRLQQGVWLTDPDLDLEVTTVVVAVGTGDILPFARMLGNNSDNCLICLPYPLNLDELDVLMTEQVSTHDRLQALLNDGGFLLSIIDLHLFKIKTLNKGLAKYFAS